MLDRPVLLVAPHPADGIVSIEAFARCLADHLEAATELVRPEARFSRMAPAKSAAQKWMAYLDKFVVFAKRLQDRAAGASLVHYCDQSCGVHALRSSPAPQLLTCTDMIAVRSAAGDTPVHRTRWTGRQLQKLVVAGMHRCDLVACISEETRREVITYAKVPEEKLAVAPMGLRRAFRRQTAAEAGVVLEKFGVPGPFILHVGGNQWYKNREGVLRIFAALGKDEALTLVLAGRALAPELARTASGLGCADRIRLAEDCTDEELEALYSTAELLLFPSLQEGFGWPIIEAQACGCAVVTSGREPLSEAAGAAAVLVDPTDWNGAAAAVRHLLKEQVADREARREAGLRNAARFSTERMTRAYERLYSGLLRERGEATVCAT